MAVNPSTTNKKRDSRVFSGGLHLSLFPRGVAPREEKRPAFVLLARSTNYYSRRYALMENMDRERTPLNRDILAGQWKQLRGTVKSWWGRLTDDDFDRIAGQKDRLIGTLQEKYGYTRDMAQQEVDRRLQEYGEHHMNPGQSYSGVENIGQTVMDTAQNMAQSASQTVNDMKTKAQEWGSTVSERAGNATSSVGQSMSSLANTIRQKAPAEGMMNSAASTMAN